MSTFGTVFTSVITSAAFGGLLVFALREVFKAWLKRHLDAYVETLKHELQREALKAELTTKQKHVTYPQVLAKLRSAESALVEFASGEWQRDWMHLDEAELTREMVRMRLTAHLRANVLNLFRSDRNVGFSELQIHAREAALDRASRLAAAADRYVLRNALYLTAPVRGGALTVAEKILGATQSVSIHGDLQEVHTVVRELETDLPTLEATMQRELEPRPHGA